MPTITYARRRELGNLMIASMRAVGFWDTLDNDDRANIAKVMLGRPEIPREKRCDHLVHMCASARDTRARIVRSAIARSVPHTHPELAKLLRACDQLFESATELLAAERQ
jgi:hypothetical protein